MMRSFFLILPCVLLPLAAFACGSSVQTTTGSGGATGTNGNGAGTSGSGTNGSGTTGSGTTGSGGATTASGTSTSGTSTGAGTGGAQACPPTPPAAQGQCTPVGLDCEYGSDPRPACRTHYRCMTVDGPGTWVATAPTCPPVPGGTCPATPAATGTCDPNGLLCAYLTGAECDCTDCPAACGMTPTWQCTPPPAAGCPGKAPNSGQACTSAGLSCQYGTCGGATVMLRVCQGGVWTDQAVPCPS